MRGFTNLEKKYGIRIAADICCNPLTGKTKTLYQIYTADGCPWENGLTKEGVKAECEKYGKQFLRIKNVIEAKRLIYDVADAFVKYQETLEDDDDFYDCLDRLASKLS